MNLFRFDAAANFRQINLQNIGNLFGRESRYRFAFQLRLKRSTFQKQRTL